MKTPQAYKNPVLTITIGGGIALAIAMGVGRFAFTPLMPLMIRDGTMDMSTGAEWAIANYIGYLLGALTASWFRGTPIRGLRVGLIGVAVITICVAWANPFPSWVGALMRGAAGAFSAWVLICTSTWCFRELACRNAASMGGWIYTGVGVGIASTGLLTWFGSNQPAMTLWIQLGLLAILGAVYVLSSLSTLSDVEGCRSKIHIAGYIQPETPPARQGVGIILCYGAFGFGYIVPATYLPAMAGQLIDNPLVFGLIWPFFGIAAALSVAIVSRWLVGWSRRKVWAAAQVIMAIGTFLLLLNKSLWVVALSAVLVGGTFMISTMAGLQLGRQLRPENPTLFLGQMTAGFATGQIAGPLLVRLIADNQLAGWDGLSLANALATLALILSSFWLWKDKGGQSHL